MEIQVSDTPNTEDTPDIKPREEWPVVKTKRDIVGNITFDPVLLRITHQAAGSMYETPAIALHFDMMTGEVRRPMIITPEMLFGIIAWLANWGHSVSQVGFAPPIPPDDDAADAITEAINDKARRPGESRREWDARLVAMAISEHQHG